jgi:hypothetical protein
VCAIHVRREGWDGDAVTPGGTRRERRGIIDLSHRERQRKGKHHATRRDERHHRGTPKQRRSGARGEELAAARAKMRVRHSYAQRGLGWRHRHARRCVLMGTAGAACGDATTEEERRGGGATRTTPTANGPHRGGSTKEAGEKNGERGGGGQRIREIAGRSRGDGGRVPNRRHGAHGATCIERALPEEAIDRKGGGREGARAAGNKRHQGGERRGLEEVHVGLAMEKSGRCRCD